VKWFPKAGAVALAVSLCLVAAACGGQAQPTPTPVPQSAVDVAQLGPNVILITDSGFVPKELTVKAGDSVTFVNQTDQIHQPTGGPMFGGGIMPKGRWSFQVSEAESFDYVDYRFPEMKGKINVISP